MELLVSSGSASAGAVKVLPTATLVVFDGVGTVP